MRYEYDCIHWPRREKKVKVPDRTDLINEELINCARSKRRARKYLDLPLTLRIQSKRV